MHYCHGRKNTLLAHYAVFMLGSDNVTGLLDVRRWLLACYLDMHSAGGSP